MSDKIWDCCEDLCCDKRYWKVFGGDFVMFLPSFDVSDPLKLLPTADRSRDKIIQMPFTRVFVILHQNTDLWIFRETLDAVLNVSLK